MSDEDEISAQAEKVSEHFEYYLLHLFDVAVAESHEKGNNDENSNEKYRKRRQALIAYVARLESRQITPEMMALWDEYQALLSEAQRTDTIVYPEERDRFRRDLWALFVRMMDKGEG
jgi:hypothetical protein